MSFWNDAFKWASGSSLSANIAKTALLGFGVKLLSDNLNESSRDKKQTVDQGVRLQLAPDTESKIPVLYGTAYFAGDITDANLSDDYRTMTFCLTLAETTGTRLSGGASSYTFNDVYLNNNRVVFKSDGVTVDFTVDRAGNQDISFRDLVKIHFYADNTGIAPLGISANIPASHTVMPGWTAGTHPMTGLMFAVVQVTYNRDKGVTGLPECVFELTNSMTLVGDVLFDYMTNTRYGAGIHSSEINTANFTELNAFCSAGFSYSNASNQTVNSPITINGIVDTNSAVLDVMEELTKAAGSFLSYDIYSGKWLVIINQAGSATASFTDSNIIGDISISGTSLTQLNNVADVKYLNNDILDKPDFVKITLPEADLFDNEPRTALQLTLPFTNTQAVALKIGAQLLKQARVDKIINFSTDYSYINLTAGDLVSVTSAVYGFNSKVFRIITAEETQGDDGELQVSFTALEYDADVYQFAVQEFQVETNDGIIQIGSIGKPVPPQVTKVEQDSRPRIVIQVETPSGVVEGMEVWLTNDTEVAEETRTYNLIATRRPVGGALYAEDTEENIEFDGLSSSDFFVKTRGFNSQVFGPYSDPSGLIAYRPVQTTQALDNSTSALGGLLGALTILDLLKSVDGLLGGQTGKSIIDGVLDTLFPGRTSTTTDVPALLLEDTAYTSAFGGTINNLNNISIDELLDVDTTTVAPAVGDFLVYSGNEWVPSGSTQDSGGIRAFARLTILDSSTVNVDSSFGFVEDVELLNSINSIKLTFATAQSGNGYVVLATKGTNTAAAGDTKTFSVFNQKTTEFSLLMSSAAVGDVYHIAVVGSGNVEICFLPIISRFPQDRETFQNPLINTPSDLVAVDADPFLVFDISSVYSLNKGTGKVELYKSNGVLSQTLNASGIEIVGNKVTFPFATRDFGTDYYILMDKGVVQGQDNAGTCFSPSIKSPLIWNFHTSPQGFPPPSVTRPIQLARSSTTVLTPSSTPLPVPRQCLTLKYMSFSTQSRFRDSNEQKADIQTNITIRFNNPIKLGTSGQLTLRKAGLIDSTVQVFDISDTFNQERVSELLRLDATNNALILNPTTDLELNTTYYVLITANCVFDTCGINGNQAISNKDIIRFKTESGPQINRTTP